jgi:hypothetical protein
MSLIALIVLALVLTAMRRTRWVGLTLLGLLVCGVFLLRVQPMRTDAPPQIAAFNSDPAIVEQRAVAALELSRRRLASATPDAVVQISPDGSRVETYFDGMKVKQTFSGDRMLIRGPDNVQVFAQPNSHQFYTPYYSTGRNAAWFKVACVGILAVLFFSFLFARRRRLAGTSQGNGAVGGVFVALAVLLVFGVGVLFFVGGTSQVRVAQQMTATPALPPRLHSPHVASHPLSSKTPQESLEDLWERLNPLRIKLDAPKKQEKPKASPAAKPSASPSAEPSEQNLLSAAEAILSQADPIKQVRLINAAKAILEVSARAAEEQSKQAAKAQLAAASASTGKVKETKHFENPGESTATTKLKADIAGARPRPDWLDSPPKFVGNGYRVIAHTDPYSTVEECYDALRKRMREIVSGHIQELAQQLDPRHYAYVPSLETLGVSDDYIKRELCPEEPFVETIDSSVGDMVRAHMLLEFQDRQNEQLLDRWRAYARQERVMVIALVGGLAILGLGLIYGLLKLDTLTRGYYTKRLFLGVPAAIIAVVVLVAISS